MILLFQETVAQEAKSTNNHFFFYFRNFLQIHIFKLLAIPDYLPSQDNRPLNWAYRMTTYASTLP